MYYLQNRCANKGGDTVINLLRLCVVMIPIALTVSILSFRDSEREVDTVLKSQCWFLSVFLSINKFPIQIQLRVLAILHSNTVSDPLLLPHPPNTQYICEPQDLHIRCFYEIV